MPRQSITVIGCAFEIPLARQPVELLFNGGHRQAGQSGKLVAAAPGLGIVTAAGSRVKASQDTESSAVWHMPPLVHGTDAYKLRADKKAALPLLENRLPEIQVAKSSALL